MFNIFLFQSCFFVYAVRLFLHLLATILKILSLSPCFVKMCLCIFGYFIFSIKFVKLDFKYRVFKSKKYLFLYLCFIFLFLFLTNRIFNCRVWWNRFYDKYIWSNDWIMAYNSFSAKNWGTTIDGDIIFDCRMSFFALQFMSFF